MKADRLNTLFPLKSEAPIPPGIPTKILGKNMTGGACTVEKLSISAACTRNGTKDWIINDIEIDGVSQFALQDLPKDLPGALFNCLQFSKFGVIEHASAVAVTVTYTGTVPQEAVFFGALLGKEPPQRPTILPIATKDPVTRTATIRVKLDTLLAIERFEIEDTDTEGGATDWLVNDIRIDGASLFEQPGPVPGDLFAIEAIENYVRFVPGQLFEVDAEYIGLNETGARLTGNICGTVVREDRTQPPPDVTAIVSASNTPGTEESFVGRCNWRPPYVRPSAG